MTDDHLIEAMAKAIREMPTRPGGYSDYPAVARAAIEAMRAAGWGPTEMCYCGTIDNPNHGYCPFCVKWFDWAEARMRKAGWGDLAKERERCAKVCDAKASEWHQYFETVPIAAKECAAAIRALGPVVPVASDE